MMINFNAGFTPSDQDYQAYEKKFNSDVRDFQKNDDLYPAESEAKSPEEGGYNINQAKIKLAKLSDKIELKASALKTKQVWNRAIVAAAVIIAIGTFVALTVLTASIVPASIPAATIVTKSITCSTVSLAGSVIIGTPLAIDGAQKIEDEERDSKKIEQDYAELTKMDEIITDFELKFHSQADSFTNFLRAHQLPASLQQRNHSLDEISYYNGLANSLKEKQNAETKLADLLAKNGSLEDELHHFQEYREAYNLLKNNHPLTSAQDAEMHQLKEKMTKLSVYTHTKNILEKSIHQAQQKIDTYKFTLQQMGGGVRPPPPLPQGREKLQKAGLLPQPAPSRIHRPPPPPRAAGVAGAADVA